MRRKHEADALFSELSSLQLSVAELRLLYVTCVIVSKPKYSKLTTLHVLCNFAHLQNIDLNFSQISTFINVSFSRTHAERYAVGLCVWTCVYYVCDVCLN